MREVNIRHISDSPTNRHDVKLSGLQWDLAGIAYGELVLAVDFWPCELSS